MSLDDTEKLLEDTVFQEPRSPDNNQYPPVSLDDSEDEVFFGPITDKETAKLGKFGSRRDTICSSDLRRSFEVSTTKLKVSSLDISIGKSSLFGRSSLLTAENSINEEEDELSDKEEDHVQDSHVTSTLESVEVIDSIVENSTCELQDTPDIHHPYRHITGRQFRNGGVQLSVCDSLSPLVKHLDRKFENKSIDAVNADYSFKMTSIAESLSQTLEEDSSLHPNDSIASNEDGAENSFKMISIADSLDQTLEEDCSLHLESIPSNTGGTLTEESIVNGYPSEPLVLDDTNIGEDSVFLRESLGQAGTSISQSFLLGHIPSVSTFEDPMPKIALTKPSESESAAEENEPEERSKYPERQMVEGNQRRSSVDSVHSVDFDSMAEEMILYDLLGPDYDTEVEAMSKEKRYRLKIKIENLTPAELSAIHKRLQAVVEQDVQDSSSNSIGSTISPFSMSPGTPVIDPSGRSPSPKARLSSLGGNIRRLSRSLGKEQKPRNDSSNYVHDTYPIENDTPNDLPAREHVQGQSNDDIVDDDIVSDMTEETSFVFRAARVSEVPVGITDVLEDGDDEDKENYANEDLHANRLNVNANYLAPTYSSLQKCSPQKACRRSPLKTPSHASRSPKFSSVSPKALGQRTPNKVVASPSLADRFGTRPITSIRPLPNTSGRPYPPKLTPSKNIDRPVFYTPSSKTTPVFKQPLPSSLPKSRIPLVKTGHNRVVASPLAEYLRSNPAPPLVQNVKPRIVKDLEATLIQADDPQTFPTLPCASYTAANLVNDVVTDTTGKDYEIYKAYGQEQTLIKVTQHVTRTRVPPTGIQWDDDSLVNLESNQSTPSVARQKMPSKGLLKRTQRNSGLFDESMMDVSLHQTQVVGKLANKGRGRGRGRGRARGRK